MSAALLALLLGSPAPPTCVTVEGAPAATSESLVIGMRERIAERDAEGLRKFVATGQTLFLAGGHPVEVLERHAESGTVKVRRGPGQLPLWTLEPGIRCDGSPAPRAGGRRRQGSSAFRWGT